jgi:CubicO group peptidase (beta-lactamase class C family)
MNTSRSLRRAALLAALVSSPAAAQERPMDPDLQAFAAELDSLRRAHGIPGLSVAVVRDGCVVLARGFGVADVERGVAATEDTPYNIASVSKPVSAVVALRLAERGVVDLDRPLSAYRGWDEFCGAMLDEGPRVFFADYACRARPLTLRDLLSMRANGVDAPRFLYNPISFSWASRPIAESAGRPFSTLVAEEVLGPAGMTRSARINRNLPLRDDLARDLAPPYHVDSAGAFVRSPPPPPQGDGAAGGVVSTVADLARFDLALDGGRLLSAESMAEMWRPGRTPAGAEMPYGIGWYVQRIDGRRVVWHSGWWERAYSALYLKLPDERLTLILLANSEGLWWGNPLDGAAVEKSSFAAAFLRRFAGR